MGWSEHHEPRAAVRRVRPVSEGREAQTFVQSASGTVEIVGLQPTAVPGDSVQPCHQCGPADLRISQFWVACQEIEREGPFEAVGRVAEVAAQFTRPGAADTGPDPIND